MVVRIGGPRRKTRYKMLKPIRRKGKVSISRYFQVFKDGETVILLPEPAVQKGIYCLRFYGKFGTVVGTQGNCYKVSFDDGDKTKVVISHPVHLKRIKK